MKYEFLVGSDPEAMIFDEKNQKLVSAIELVPGTKNNPYPIGNGCFIQQDNVMVEWCVPPTKHYKELYESIKYCIDFTNNMLPQDHKVLIQSSGNYSVEDLNNPIAQEFGCEPDYNAWTFNQNPRPHCKNPFLRSCGGHIHIGHDSITPSFGRLLDLYLGIPSLFLDHDTERKLLYGKAGSYRIKDYGIEYRTLSNFWINDLATIEWIFESIDQCLDRNFAIHANDFVPPEVADAINKNNLVLAKEIMNKFKLKQPEKICVD